jgi:Flp pilus assembly protein TadG
MDSMKRITGAGVRNRMRGRPGQGLVEFVMIAPLLLLLIFGLVEFARAWNIRHVITDAAREGARTLAVDNGVSIDSVQTVVESALESAGLNPANATITLVQCEGADCVSPTAHQRHMASRVSIAYPYELRLIRVFLGWALGDAVLDINTTFVMRNE